MARQCRAALKEDSPYLLFDFDENNIRAWHFLVVNLPPPFKGGEFIFSLEARALGGNDFPHTPPRFRFLTPNGVYETEKNICISIGEFHANDRSGKTGSYGWRPVLGMIGFAREVVNTLLVPETVEDGIAVIPARQRSDRGIERLAAASIEHNDTKHPDLVKRLRGFARANPGLVAAKAWARLRGARRLGLRDFGGAAPPLAAAFGPEAWAAFCDPGEDAPSAEKRLAFLATDLASASLLRKILSVQDDKSRAALACGLRAALAARNGDAARALSGEFASLLGGGHPRLAPAAAAVGAAAASCETPAAAAAVLLRACADASAFFLEFEKKTPQDPALCEALADLEKCHLPGRRTLAGYEGLCSFFGQAARVTAEKV